MGISRHRMALDGKGVCTLVAFYGCPLECKYCLNKHCKQEKTLRCSMTANELLEIVELDNIYYRMTGGGITFGGGEPLSNSGFISEFCEKADDSWTMTMETSLYGEWEQVECLIPFINMWIVDIKDTDPEIYKSYTGKDNTCVMENLEKLKSNIGRDKILVRIPKIPGYNNEEHMKASWTALDEYNKYRFKYIKC